MVNIIPENDVMRVLICGDRNWSDYNRISEIVKRLIAKYGKIEIIEGGCRGADVLARKAAIECGVPYKEFPANWTKYGKSAGPIRNQQMLDEGMPSMVIAFHSNISTSKGTKDMIERARKHQIPSYIIKK